MRKALRHSLRSRFANISASTARWLRKLKGSPWNMEVMTSRFTALRLSLSTALVLVIAGCGTPLSENWSDYTPPAAPAQIIATTPPSAAPEPEKKLERVAPDCSIEKCVALTFDDGPGSHTPELLKVLAQYDAKATFFLIGENVAKHPDIVKAELDAGHEIGNHSWAHKDLSKMSVTAAKKDLQKSDDAIQKAIEQKATLVRPPFGALAPSLKKSLDVPVALWSVDTLDWKTRDTKKTEKSAEKVKPGDIVLMHDIHESTVKAVPEMLKTLKAQGYHFVTVTEIIGKPKDGIGYGTGQSPATKK
ncbi:polysaccharide deacetylase family protein [Arthrobacter sp. MYb227]|uniref:polysaccharide deacetylase family protein n=1 Tax=Arthrobacter sp. MYb227 TaxID=1848601 RepID=UPI00215724A8|nr:polysaccharide deacetylase family protein [Arthrobacter sp. MYb227]